MNQTSEMLSHRIFDLFKVFVLCSALLFGGCVSSVKKEPCEPEFPPKQAMESGNYENFFRDNVALLNNCQNMAVCEEALFNIGFLYAYSKSPYYDRPKALKYLGKIVKDYPLSPQAFEAMVWMDLITENVTLDKKQRDLESEVKSKNATIRNKNAKINALRDQMKRSRDIDVEMGQKEREVLY